MEYLPWKNDQNDDSLAWVCSDPFGDEFPKSYELDEGVSIRRWFPEDVTFDLSKDHGIQLADSIPNVLGVHIVSDKLKGILEREADATFEFYPAQIRNQKGRMVTTQYYLAHLLDTLDCLDKKKSDFDVDNLDKSRAFRIRRLAFNEKAIPAKTKVFGLQERKEQWFVRRDLAVKIYREENCRGMIFTKLEDFGKEWRFKKDDDE